MKIFLLISQVFNSLLLLIIGFIPEKLFNCDKNKVVLKPFLKMLFIIVGIVALFASGFQEYNVKNYEEKNQQQMDTIVIKNNLLQVQTGIIQQRTDSNLVLLRKIQQLLDSLFIERATRVMNAPKEVTPQQRPEPTAQLSITSPSDGSNVPWRLTVEGTISDLNAAVWVIVHPVGVASYWVQPAVTVSENGIWNVRVYIGGSGNIYTGREFDIIAIANPRDAMYEGKILSKWPAAQWSSQVITVRRQ